MAHSRTELPASATYAASDADEVTSVRMDSAHWPSLSTNRAPQETLPDGRVDGEPSNGPVPDEATELSRQRLQYHGEQLQALLERRQQALDRREAQWHAQVARFEEQIRAERLRLNEQWLEVEQARQQLHSERQRLDQASSALAAAQLAFEQEAQRERQLLEEKRRELELRIAAVAQRERSVEQREKACDESMERLKQREEQWEWRRLWEEQQLAYRTAEMQRMHRRLLAQLARAAEAQSERSASIGEPRTAEATCESARLEWHLSQRLEDLSRLERELLLQRDRLLETEARLARQQKQLDQARQLWRHVQHEEQVRLRTAQRRWEQLRQRHEQTWRNRQQLVLRWLATAQSARHDAVRLHGESLELRMAAEQIWRGLSMKLDPASQQVATSLRFQVARYFQEQRQELAAEHQRLQQLRSELDQLRQVLDRQLHDWHQWFAQQQSLLEQEATRLCQARRQWEQEQWELLNGSGVQP